MVAPWMIIVGGVPSLISETFLPMTMGQLMTIRCSGLSTRI